MAAEYINSQIAQFPEAAEIFRELQSLHQKKLYHQLSTKLQQLLTIPFFCANDTLFRLYQGFVRHFEKHTNQVELVIFAIRASKQCGGFEAAASFLEEITKKVETDKEAYLLCLLERAECELNLGKIEECKEKIEEARIDIDNYEGMAPLVHSAFYRVCLMYHKLKGTPSDYYQNALMYLSYTDFEDITESDRIMHASDLALASLVGENVYNFGELLQHPVLKVLEGTQFEWLGRLLYAFNSGDISLFEELCEAHGHQALLTESTPFLQQKIRIMCLIEMIFKRGAHDRAIYFKEISETCRLAVEEVELLLMKAMSLGLIQGTIDEVDQMVQVKWVQGRILDLDQISGMKDRLSEWSKEVDGTVRYLEARLENPQGL